MEPKKKKAEMREELDLECSGECRTSVEDGRASFDGLELLNRIVASGCLLWEQSNLEERQTWL